MERRLATRVMAGEGDEVEEDADAAATKAHASSGVSICADWRQRERRRKVIDDPNESGCRFKSSAAGNNSPSHVERAAICLHFFEP